MTSKSFPLNYISHLLYRKNVDNYNDYLSLKENSKLLQWSKSLAKKQIVLVQNKLLFAEFLAMNNIPTPPIFFHNSKNQFAYEGKIFEIETKNDFCSFLTKVFREKKIEHIFCKPVDGVKGENIFILRKATHQKIEDDLIDMIFSRSFIFQEVIPQNEVLKMINPSSVNTLRIATYKNEGNEVEILSGLVRVGRTGSIVDNAHKGGIVVPFDKETGKLRDEGLQLIDNGGGIFQKHPDTGIIFENLQLPHYQEVKELVAQVSSLFDFPLLGWDVAITPRGPTIVEVNHDFHLLLSDRTEKGLRKTLSIKKLLEQVQ
nr:sugar-transfer associated ATP-grasp domain-containing protein [Maribacter aestuarii]